MQDDRNPTVSRPVAYTLLAGAVIGTGALAITAPQTFAAGMGSVGSQAAVFLTPFWRFIKRVNELYTDTGAYLKEDTAKLRRHFGRAPKPIAPDAPKAPPARKPVFSRLAAYSILGATALTAGVLAVIAPTVLAAAVGSVTVSGASFTKPVIDLVERVNNVYNDVYGYLKKDVLHPKAKRPDLIPIEPVNEIDRSIYAPITEARTPYTKAQTYGILALGGFAALMLAVHAPAVLIAALGTIAGSAISYTSPALQFVKKFNSVYDKAEHHVIEDLEIANALGLERKPPAQGPNLPKPVSYLIMGSLVVGAGVVAIYAPSILAAALGAIAGSASSFTDPVLKQVGYVNDFYVDAVSHLKEDWNRAARRQPQPAADSKPAADAAAGTTPAPANDTAANDNTLGAAFNSASTPLPEPGEKPQAAAPAPRVRNQPRP